MIAPAIFFAVLFIVGFLPLLGGPRYEAALLAGVLGPSWVGVVVCYRTLRRLGPQASLGAQANFGAAQQGRDDRPLVQHFLDGFYVAVAHLFALFAAALGHGLVGGVCEPGPGFALLALGPGLGLLLGSMWGTGAGVVLSLVRRSTRRAWVWASLGILAPLVSALWALYRFYSTPTVYAYDQFAGYFSGPLYDTVEYDLDRLLSFRAGTFLFATGVLLLFRGFVVHSQEGKRASIRSGRLANRSLFAWVLGLGLLSGYVALLQQGEALGHRGSARGIKKLLGHELHEGVCRVYYSERVQRSAARRVAVECLGYLRQHRAFFDLVEQKPVSIYLFADDDEKRRLMGAGRTNIAKPWRAEIYITDDGFPHPILGHELAHVVTGDFGSGPFRVAGALGGLIVDPGRVEGFAEAAAWREESFGTLEQWAAAMRRVGRLPALRQLFQLGFLGESASRSYTAAGAFVEFVRQEHGPRILKSWYRGEGLPTLTATTFSQLERDWHAHLDALSVPESVLRSATPRFSRPGLFARKCPHATDRKLVQLSAACATDETRARELIEAVMAWDPNQEGLRLEAPRCVAMQGDARRALSETEELIRSHHPFEPHERRRAEEFLGDMFWQLGQNQEAGHHYRAAQEIAFEPELLRQLEVKRWALEQAVDVQQALKKLFIRQAGQEWSIDRVLVRWQMLGPASDFASYLLARTALAEQRFDEARSFLLAVNPAQLPSAAVALEHGRMRVIAGCERALMQGNEDDLKVAWGNYQLLNPSPAERMHLARLVDRCQVD